MKNDCLAKKNPKATNTTPSKIQLNVECKKMHAA